MAGVRKEYIVKIMQEKELPFFVIKDSDGKSILNDQQDPEVSLKQSIDMLEETIENIDGPFVYVSLSAKTRKAVSNGGDVKTGTYNYKVLLTPDKSISGISDTNPTVMRLLSEVTELKTKLVEKEKEYELRKLRDEFDQFRKESKESNPMADRALNLLSGMFGAGAGAAVSQQTQPTPGIAGTDEDKEARKSKLKAALNRLSSVDKNLPETLTLLADFAEKNPSQYFGFIPMVKNMI